MKLLKVILIFTITLHLLNNPLNGQNETNMWYFGKYAALDFLTNPPSIINNSVMHALEGSASAADASGNLLFYSQGTTVWNRLHQVMANGAGLLGHPSATQSS